jgi:hypothetical protein
VRKCCDKCGQEWPDDVLAIAQVDFQPAYAREFTMVVTIDKKKYQTTLSIDQDIFNVGHKGIPLGDPAYPCVVTLTMQKEEV